MLVSVGVPVLVIAFGIGLGLSWSRLWMAKIFRVEFGQSDLSGNYSRTYAWMANQLGHMTLGLGTALALYWVIELFGALFERMAIAAAPPGVPVGAAPAAGPPHAYLWVTLAVAALVLAANWLMLSGRPEVKRRGDIHRETRIDLAVMRRTRTWGLALTTALALLGLVFVLGALWLDIGALAVFDWWFRGPGGVTNPTVRALLARDTLVALGAAGLGLSLWFTKEFCSDQSGIGREIGRAAWRRAGSDPGWTPEARVPDSACPGPRAAERLRIEGLWDSATDGFFYLAGAAMAVGIVASHPDPATAFAESAMEVVAVIGFIVIFLVTGRRYGYRQQAMDRTGTPYAWRLGFVDSVVRVEGLATGCPLDAMLDFSTAAPDGESRHVVVFGGPGSGKTPFVVSLATEAALAHIPVNLFADATGIETPKVRVRYTILDKASLRESQDRVSRRRDAELDGALSAAHLVQVEGRVLNDLAEANFVVIDNIPFADLEAVIDGDTTRGEELRDLIAHFSARPGRWVWAIDPPGRSPRTRGPEGGQAASAPVRTAAEGARGLADAILGRRRVGGPAVTFVEVLRAEAPEPASGAVPAGAGA